MLSRRKLPSLNALRAFEAAGRRLSFRAAADELGVTQGAVAQQVRALEEHLGVVLFQRMPRGLVLTSKGALYLADIGRAFDVMGEATEQLLASPETVTISVPPSFASKLLIPRLAELNAAFPDVELRTVATESLADFDRDQVDIAVRLSKESFPDNLQAIVLFRQQLIAVASPYFIADNALPFTLEQLHKLPLLHDSHQQWSTFLGVRGRLPGAVFNQTTLALDAALAGQGVALACRAFVATDLDAGRLVQVTDKVLTIEPPYSLVRKNLPCHRKAVEEIWRWCAQRLAFQ
ncbi:LysR substrate-binding domain-containing protein [Marinomonas pollencensis]|uniref:DNA-binding transcriptional LysR family regulator n=1 Tax=Marinomonas pollencensis TaxID=491954 RepID=A0A3E0D9U6_9GAMM|nr:LysR substrate-binding domain-containing protein [Marinomonas pollencensis]REG79446.1 DNA-binding transcriptional LysR family regulator [Marinomonas pollencensis]